MSPATSVTLANGPATMVLFSCSAGGNYIYDSLSVYDQELKLLGSLEQWGGTAQRLPASFDSYRMEELKASGDTFTFAVSGIEVLGDDSSHAGAKTGKAQETVKWTGAGFAVTALSFSTPSGEVAAPDQAEVQAFFDAAASGDDALVAKHTSGETLSHIQTGCVGLCETEAAKQEYAVRGVFFPKGAKVNTCQLIGADDSILSNQQLPSDAGEDGSTGTLVNFWSEGLKPGSFACGIDTSGVEAKVPSSRAEGYNTWLVIEPTADPKDFTVKVLGRSFN